MLVQDKRSPLYERHKRDALIYIFAYKLKIPRVFGYKEHFEFYEVKYEEPMFSGKYHFKIVKKSQQIDEWMTPLIEDLEFRSSGMEFPQANELADKTHIE